MSNPLNDAFDDEIPWAAPESRRDYEAALGRFLLAFNRLDHTLTEVLETIIARIGRYDLRETVRKAEFQLKLLVLDLLKASKEGRAIERISIGDIKQISGLRGFLAHAHYDENPFDGSYALVNRKNEKPTKAGKQKRVTVYTVEQIDAISERTDKICHDLRYSLAYFDFSDAALPQGADGGTGD